MSHFNLSILSVLRVGSSNYYFCFLVFAIFANVLYHVGHSVVNTNRGVHRPRRCLGEEDLERRNRCRGGLRPLEFESSIVILLLSLSSPSHED